MIRTVLVVIHAGAGIAGLVTGLPSFALPRGGDGRSWVRWVYLACIAIMFVTLIALVVLDWEGLDTTARVAFTALTGWVERRAVPPPSRTLARPLTGDLANTCELG